MKRLLVFWTFLIILQITVQQQKNDNHNVTIVALKTGEVRVYIPHEAILLVSGDRKWLSRKPTFHRELINLYIRQLSCMKRNVNGAKFFAFHASVNEDLDRTEPGTYYNTTTTRTGDYWTLTFNMAPLVIGDAINYWYYFAVDKKAHEGEGIWEVKGFKDSLDITEQGCTSSVTIINGRKANCANTVIFEDNFDGPSTDTSKWLVHHKIPTYSEPDFEFNSYLNEDDTRFYKNGKIYLKPVPITDEDNVRGTLNLTDKCTSNKLHECLYTQKSSFLLPPVKSAKITSKISFQYGKIEIKAKLPSGDWIVPIIQLEDKAKTEGDNSPVVWIAYSRGNKVLLGNGPDDYGSRLLFGGPVVYPSEPIRSKFLASKYANKPFNSDYHIYTFVWKPGKMIFYVDNEVFGDISTEKGFADYSFDLRSDWTKPDAPYNREYELSLGVAVGGLYHFPDGFNSDNDPKPWTNTERNYILHFFNARATWMKSWYRDDVALKVDYVKISAV